MLAKATVPAGQHNWEKSLPRGIAVSSLVSKTDSDWETESVSWSPLSFAWFQWLKGEFGKGPGNRTGQPVVGHYDVTGGQRRADEGTRENEVWPGGTGRTASSKVAEASKICVCVLQSRAAFLLELLLWIHDLLRLHGREFLGYDLQRHQLDLP